MHQMRTLVIIFAFTVMLGPSVSGQVANGFNFKIDNIITGGGTLQRINIEQVNLWSDSLKEALNKSYRYDSVKIKLKIDSMKAKGERSFLLQSKMDSLSESRERISQIIAQKKDSIITSVEERYSTWKNRLTSIRDSITARGLPVGAPKEIAGLNTPNLPSLPPLPELPQLGKTDLATVKLPKELSNLAKAPLTELPSVGLSDKLNLSALDEVKAATSDPVNAAENVAENLKPVKDMQGRLSAIDELKNTEVIEAVQKAQDPEALRQEAKEMVLEKAVDHFEGKAAVLEEAMQKVAKYKQKYSHVNSLSEIPKRPPNPLKGKPFIERLVPAITFQIFKGDNLLLDVNPAVAYRFNGRFNSGIGWNQRLSYNLDKDRFNSFRTLYGPRVFSEYLAWKGFSVRAELELMRTDVPIPIRHIYGNDAGTRQWVFTPFAGIKKKYRIMKGVNGTAFIMTNLYNPQRKSPYPDVINSRFGFEFKLKRKRVD